MTPFEREFLLASVLAGFKLVKVRKKRYRIYSPSTSANYRAQLIYQSTLEEAKEDGLWGENQALDYLLSIRVWTPQKEARLEGLQKDIEELKIGLFRMTFGEAQRHQIKAKIREAEKELVKLFDNKNCLNYVTYSGVAALGRLQYLAGSSFRRNGKRIFPSNFLSKPFPYFDDFLFGYTSNQLKDTQYRELARTEPWRSYWTPSSSQDLFGRPIVEWTEEQRNLVLWTRFYDNIYESPDCPSSRIIEDDDALDGWLILQRRKRESDEFKGEVEGKISDKIGKCDEIFVPVGDSRLLLQDPSLGLKDAKKLNTLNDVGAKILKMQRLNKIRGSESAVQEINMPGSLEKILEKRS